MCYNVVNIISDMDEETMTNIEMISNMMHANLQEQLSTLDTNGQSPEELFKMVIGNMGTIIDQKNEDLVPLGNQLTNPLSADNPFAEIMSKAVPNLLSAVSSANKKPSSTTKLDVLDKFSQINGNVK